MTLLSLKDITNCNDYYIDDETFQIYSFKQKKYEHGKLLKPHYTKDGYIQYRFNVNGKVKYIFYHHIITIMFINPNFDSTKYDIDHLNHDRQDNRIENLAIVSRLENNRNTSRSWNGNKFNFINDIGKSLIINEEAGIYYSLELDKFYMFINHTNKFKELHETLGKYNYPRIQYCYNNKKYDFYTTKFRRNVNKK